MSESVWNIGLSVGQSFAEFTAIGPDKRKIQNRWFIPRVPLLTGLEKLFSENPELKGSTIKVTTELAHLIMKRRAGPSIALLLTSGFEDWPRIRQPLKEQTLTLSPHRSSPLINRDLIFGVAERTDAQGNILEELKTEDLEFLTSKLQLTETKQIAVGFLHSTLNPTNEKKAAAYLREKGFEVLASHEIEENNNEVARWWRSFLNAYIAPAFHELETELAPFKEKHEVKLRFWSSDGTSFEGDASKYFSSTFGQVAALNVLAKESGAKSLIHFGLDHFYYVRGDEQTHIWQSEFGPVAIPAPFFKRLQLQPTMSIGLSRWGFPHFEENELGYEPGPMLLGRSVRPSLVDVLYLRDHLWDIDGLAAHIKQDSKKKIESIFMTFQKGLTDDDVDDDLTKVLEDRAFALVAEEIVALKLPEPILLTGPLALSFIPSLKKNLPQTQFIGERHFSYGASWSASTERSPL